MENIDKLFCELGKLLVEAEILGVLSIPSAGKIGSVKKQLQEEFNKKPKTEPPAPEKKEPEK